MDTVDDVRSQLVAQYADMRSEDPSMIELIGASFIADEAGILRAPNDEYISRELTWYLSQSRHVDDIPGETPKIWREVANDEGYINSNYGALIFGQYNHLQYQHVLEELERKPASRRGVMIYNRPTMHTDATFDGMNDFVCTNAVNYFVRYDQLHAVVQMRSNDAVFGYPNDLAWQRYVLERLAGDLNVDYGPIIWQAASLHIYPRHYHLLEALLDES